MEQLIEKKFRLFTYGSTRFPLLDNISGKLIFLPLRYIRVYSDYIIVKRLFRFPVTINLSQIKNIRLGSAWLFGDLPSKDITNKGEYTFFLYFTKDGKDKTLYGVLRGKDLVELREVLRSLKIKVIENYNKAK